MSYEKKNNAIENQIFSEYRIQQNKINEAIRILRENNYIVYKQK